MARVYFGMIHSSAPTLFSDPEIDTKGVRTYVNACLWFDDRDGYRVIFCRHEPLYRVALSDTNLLATICVMLRQSALATQEEIAAAFGHSVATQRRWETRFQRLGDVGLHGKKSTGRRPKLDPSQCSFVKHWFTQGLSNLEMARRLAVNEATIRRVLRHLGLQRRSQPAAELPLADTDRTPANPLATPGVFPAEATALEPVATVAPLAPQSVPVMATTLDAIVVTTTSPSEPTVHTVSTPVGPVPVQVFTIDRDPDDRAGDRLLARQGLLDDAAPLFGDHEELPHAGVLLALPMLLGHGGLDVFDRLFGSIGPAFYGLRT